MTEYERATDYRDYNVLLNRARRGIAGSMTMPMHEHDYSKLRKILEDDIRRMHSNTEGNGFEL